MKKKYGLTDVEQVDGPVEMNEEHDAPGTDEPMEPVKSNTLYAKKTKHFRVKIKTPLNVRTGPGFNHEAVDTILGGIRKVFEEQNGWGRIGEDKWINISSAYVDRL